MKDEIIDGLFWDICKQLAYVKNSKVQVDFKDWILNNTDWLENDDFGYFIPGDETLYELREVLDQDVDNYLNDCIDDLSDYSYNELKEQYN